jgi:hypothetical protein
MCGDKVQIFLAHSAGRHRRDGNPCRGRRGLRHWAKVLRSGLLGRRKRLGLDRFLVVMTAAGGSQQQQRQPRKGRRAPDHPQMKFVSHQER